MNSPLIPFFLKEEMRGDVVKELCLILFLPEENQIPVSENHFA